MDVSQEANTLILNIYSTNSRIDIHGVNALSFVSVTDAAVALAP